MRKIFLSLYCLPIFATPPEQIPSDLLSRFTINSQIPIVYRYRDDSYPSNQALIYTTQQIDQFIDMAKEKKTLYYGATDTYLYQALEKYLSHVAHKNVAVMGSNVPWYESILLAYDSHPTTIEYNQILNLDPRLEVLTVDQYENNKKQFDAILSISSFEHDGLGRYGDPIHPDGDLIAMEKAKGMLKEGGLLFLAVPVGRDCLVWNLHRIYGKIRLKALLKGWRIVEYFGFTNEDLDKDGQHIHQPIFVLSPIGRSLHPLERHP